MSTYSTLQKRRVLSLGYSKQLLTNYVKEGLLERCRHGVAMTLKAMSLKAKIKNYAKSDNIAAQVALQNYMFERFLGKNV